MRFIKLGLLYLMAVLYIGAGVLHFHKPQMYVDIMPPYIPWPLLMVYISGAAEIFFGLLLFAPPMRSFAAWGIIALLVAVFPANLHMALHPDQFKIAPWLLYLRLPLQLLLILWAWWYTRDEEAIATETSAVPL